MRPTSFKEYFVKSLIVRANWLTKELQELERLRAWEKKSKCYECGELVSRHKSVSCAFCDNTSCCNDSCPMSMFYGFDENNDPMCNDCSKKRCAICYKINKLTKCDMQYCTAWICDDCTEDIVCSCGIKNRWCSERCYNDSNENPEKCYNCDIAICRHNKSDDNPCVYRDCENTICTKCFNGTEYYCGDHREQDESEDDELVKLAKLLN